MDLQFSFNFPPTSSSSISQSSNSTQSFQPPPSHFSKNQSRNLGCIESVVNNIWVLMEHLLTLHKQSILLEAIKEVSLNVPTSSSSDEQGGDENENQEDLLSNVSTPSWLSPFYKRVLIEEDSILSQLTQSPQMLQTLLGVISDLFVDYQKLKFGKDARYKLGGLHEMIQRVASASSSSSIQQQQQTSFNKHVEEEDGNMNQLIDGDAMRKEIILYIETP